VQSVSVSIDGLEASTTSYGHRPQAAGGAPSRRSRTCAAAGAQIACNTQINRLTRRELLPLLELLAPRGVRAWQLQITVAHGNAADHPELLLQPYMILELFDGVDPRPRSLRRARVRSGPPTTSATSARSSTASAASSEPRRPLQRLRRRQARPRHRERRRDQELPQPRRPANIGGNWREHGLRAIWSAPPRSATSAAAPSTISGATAASATTPSLHGRLHRRLRAAARPPWQQPLLPPPGARDGSHGACASASSRSRPPAVKGSIMASSG
jgi:hypothetical protein